MIDHLRVVVHDDVAVWNDGDVSEVGLVSDGRRSGGDWWRRRRRRRCRAVRFRRRARRLSNFVELFDELENIKSEIILTTMATPN